MRYSQKTLTIKCEQYIEEVNQDDVTKVMITINLKEHNKTGLSLDLLIEIIDSCTKNLSSYRIFHSPDGLTITGRYG